MKSLGLMFFCSASLAVAELPDIRSVPADLAVPALGEGSPAAGKRVKQTLSAWQGTPVYHVLYLPTDWKADTTMPVIVELGGNAYTNEFGDVSTGRPEGGNLGYGLSAGRGFIWLCVPYLNSAGNGLALTWWGDAPGYDPQPTLKYLRQAVKSVCRQFAGDKSKVLLCGFSRGAIACNYLGLHDDQTAKLWRGFLACSHYDGVRSWPFSGSDRASSLVRLQRLGHRPQFICAEGSQAGEIEKYLKPLLPGGRLTFAGTGFRNHTGEWILRPGPARESARNWLAALISNP